MTVNIRERDSRVKHSSPPYRPADVSFTTPVTTISVFSSYPGPAASRFPATHSIKKATSPAPTAGADILKPCLKDTLRWLEILLECSGPNSGVLTLINNFYVTLVLIYENGKPGYSPSLRENAKL